MKTFSKFTPIGAAFALIFLLACTSFAQIKVGGYKSMPAESAEAIEAAEFAAQAQGEKENAEIVLDSVKTAERQVVAGTNFRLCMVVSIAAADEDVAYTQMVKVVVFRNLKKQFSLTSWTEEECSQEEAQD